MPASDERIVYVFWDSSNNPEDNADTYRQCVENSPNNTCGVTAQKVDVATETNQDILKYWSGTATIEVVGVKNGAVVPPRLVNPSLFCSEINQLVKKLCQ